MDIKVRSYCLIYILCQLMNANFSFCDSLCKHKARGLKGLLVTCAGLNITKIPYNLPGNTTKLYFSGTNIRTVPSNSFSIYPELTELFFRDTSSEPCKLETLEPGAFDGLVKLETLGMIGCNYLTHIGAGVLKTFQNLETLHVYRSGLQSVPDLSQFKTLNPDMNGIMREIDFHNNRIKKIQTEDFLGVKTDMLKLEENKISSVAAKSFRNATIVSLSLNMNTQLTDVDDNAFEGIILLNKLDLSNTKISSLPTKGLSGLRYLILKNTPSMKHLPSVLEFTKIERAELTYPHHCCAFKNPEKQDPSAWKAKQAQEIINKACAISTTPFSTTQKTSTTQISQLGWMSPRDDAFTNNHFGKFGNKRKKRHSDDGFGTLKIPNNTNHGSPQMVDIFWNAGHNMHNQNFHKSTVSVNENVTQRADCGEIYIYNRNVECTPEPDAFNPCEDVMGYEWLRVTVWFVLLAALLGNSVVLIVLTSSRGKFTVPKFLMCNLAFADFIMGVYLILLASIDVRTLGEYFNHAVKWQNEGGCQAAGFLSVFSSELSVFTLTILTLERWYAISHAIHLNKRLKLRQSVALMVLGYTFASILALLPLIGISSYGNVSICLPMRAQSGVDIGYIVSLLIMNGIMFLAICFCYISMFLKVKGSASTRRSNDATIAKRMSILVITNFACWAPIAFFGLTASAGVPFIDITHSKILLVFFYPLNSCANPFLYAILTKQFRKDVFILLGKFGICVERANMYRGTVTSRLSHSRGHKDSTSHRIHRHTESVLTHLSGSNQSSRSCVNGTPKVHPSHRRSSSEAQPFIERRSHLDRAAEFANKEPMLAGEDSMLDSWEPNDPNDVQKPPHPTYIRSVSDYVAFGVRKLPDKSHLRTRTSVDTFLSNSTDTTYVSENSPSQDDVWQMRKDVHELKNNADERETETVLSESKVTSPTQHADEEMCQSVQNMNTLSMSVDSDKKDVSPRVKKEKSEIKSSYRPVNSTLHELRSRFRRSPSLSSLDEGNEMRLLANTPYNGSCLYDEEGTEMLSGNV
ncbi:follicle-stimulating hormone receptor-like isoform X1 [Ruditapes philippinarum]|uniref:follicle-stimulating hormone receptor-like isoform X1 n=1 Tax=Ruditapes philippinarum TaxID=129788 RepID=UPI00295C0EFE|nr:follicle-stimulating hormone receptor-like isoform X1 [Ruditapes philippinarum]